MRGILKKNIRKAGISCLLAAAIAGMACSTDYIFASGIVQDTEAETETGNGEWLVSSMIYAVTQDGETVQVTYEYEYDENGVLISRTLSGGNSSKVLYYEYDEEGREIREYTDTREKVIAYDEQGRVVSEISSMIDGDAAGTGTVYQSTFYTYDEQENLLSQITTDADETVTESFEYTYDEENRVLTYDHTSEDDEEEHWAYEYTEDGYNISKSETGLVEYYDEDGQLNSYEEKDDDGNVTSAADYHYDADGNIESVEMVDGTVVSYTYTRDENGNILTLVRHAENETYGTVGNDDYCEDYTYDAEGRVLTYRYYVVESGTEYEQSNYEYAYDDYGNMTYYKSTETDGTITEYTYTYIRK